MTAPEAPARIGHDDGTAAHAVRAVVALRGPATLAAFAWAEEWARRYVAEGRE